MGFLIPTVRHNPSLLGRLGRLAYWSALSLAALLLILAVMIAAMPLPSPRLDGLHVDQGLSPAAFVFWAAFVAVIGRGMRYLFAGE